MIINVSISQFRQNLADYIAKVVAGHMVILENEKKDQQVIALIGKKKFNANTFVTALKEAAGVFTTENHPEWRTKEKVAKWVKSTRSASDRQF